MTARPVRTNKYAGPCRSCKNTVPAGEGLLEKVAGAWVITHISPCPAPAPAAQPAGRAGLDLTGLPACKYMVTGDAGQKVHVEIVERRGGRRFLNVLVGAPGDWKKQWVSMATQATLANKIRNASYSDAVGGRALIGPEAAAVRFSREHKCCAACGSPLSDESQPGYKVGLGPVCVKRFEF